MDFISDHTLYCLNLQEHNKFIFLFLDSSSKMFLEHVLSKMDINYVLILLYSQLDKYKENELYDYNYKGLFPEEIYNENILKNTVSYFNKLYNINITCDADDIHMCNSVIMFVINETTETTENNFNKVYKDFIKYYTINYDIMKKNDELNNYTFKKYNDTEQKKTKQCNENIKDNNTKINNNDNSKEDAFFNTTTTHMLRTNTHISRDNIDYTNIENGNFQYSNMYSNITDDYGISTNYNNMNYDNISYLLFYCSTLYLSFVLNKIEYDDCFYKIDFENNFSNNLKIEFIKEIKTNNNNIEYIESLFNNNCVASRECLMNTVLLYENVYKHEYNIISIDLIKQFINTTYIITDNKEDKIKSSDLLNIISKNINVQDCNIGIKNKISKMLNEIGLKKYRLSDGYYFYGLRTKREEKYISNDNIDDVNNAYMRLVEERNKEYETKNKYYETTSSLYTQ
jgi:hypothetical protein